MCGIAGIYSHRGIIRDVSFLLGNMLARIQHRGPDESGIFCDSQVALGSVRLSIIDISTGQQPLSTPDGKMWIVFNGEIFNYPELKQGLLKRGHEFHTQSDTEVLLHAWQEYGTACFNLLNGQFALAIWDQSKKELILARDRVGIRPLFYTWHEDHFIFGSEIKAILEFPGIKPAFDPRALAQVFSFWTTLSPGTIFEGISELPPGHYMRISAGIAEVKQWWKLSFPSDPGGYFKGSFNEAKEELGNLLTDSVKLRLRADVPVAAYLSGGLDSSATTALIKNISPQTLQTFSIGFEDAEFDETPFQQEVSSYLQTRHTSFYCSNEEIGRYFPDVVWHSEIPILRTAPVPMYCLSKKVRENNIKVVITGEGADEMLAGYDIFKEAIIREFWSKQPGSKYRPLLLNKLYPYLAQFKDRNKSMLKLFYEYRLADTGSPFYSHLLRWHNTGVLLNYLSPDIRSGLNGYDPLNEALPMLDRNFNQWDRLGKAQWLEINMFMSGYLLSSQGDRVAMANSVEGRYPFLDYRVMEFAATLPPDFKMHGLNEKYILKKLMKDKLPENILKRPKQAYRAPVSKSFFDSAHLMYVNEMLSEKGLQETGLFNPLHVKRLRDKLRDSTIVTEIDNMALAGILSTQLLYHQFITGNRYKPALIPLVNCRTVLNNA